MRSVVTRDRDRRAPDKGFTLVELLAVLSLSAILMTLAVGAIRNYWFVRALHGTQNEIITELRHMHQRAVSDSNPLVHGAHFGVGDSIWRTIRYDPESGTCTETGTIRMGTGITIDAVRFDVDPVVTGFCRSVIAGAADHEFVLFYARGSATSGALDPATDLGLVIEQSNLNRTLGVTVSPLTGRVDAE